MRRFKIAVDFDGTIVDHRYPDIGPFVPGALEFLRKWSRDPRNSVMLWTMRCHDGPDGDTLRQAIDHCNGNGILLDLANWNLADKSWTSSPKLYANVYIDDAAAGTPLTEFPAFKRPCVDWGRVGPLVEAQMQAYHAAGE